MKPIECYRGVVHPWLCDVMGHLTTRHYMAMFDDASYHLFSAIGFGEEQLQSGVGLADVRTSISYKAELSTGALTLVTGRVVKVGTKSLTNLFVMHNATTGDIAAEMESVTVQFDLKKRAAMEVVPSIREQIEQLMGDD